MLRTCLAWFGILFGLVCPALADWREEVGTFRVSIAAGSDAALVARRAEPFRLALEQALGMPVEIVPARDYPALIDAASHSRIEYAILSASAYAAAWTICECVEPLVVASTSSGETDFRQIIIARQGGPAAALDLNGRKLALVDSEAAGGAMLARYELQSLGVDLDSQTIILQKFDRSDEAIDALTSGNADAMLGWSSMTGDPASGYSRGTLRRIAELGGQAGDYRVIWQSSPIPHRVHAIRKNIDGEAKTILRSLLTNMFGADPVAYDSVEPAFGGGFTAARQGQFEPIAAIFRQKGLSQEPVSK